MELGGRFVPFAGQAGLLAEVTYFFLLATVWAFLASFLVSIMTRERIVPEHRMSRVLTAAIAAVAGLSYYFIQDYYREMLRELSKITDPAQRANLVNLAYVAIGQLRYMDWAITTPLLLIKTVLMLKIKPHEIKRSLTVLLLADVWMVVTGFIGEQQLGPDGAVLPGPRLVWGGISTLGYLLIPVILYQYWRHFRERGTHEEQLAYRLMALTTVTTWGVYPLGYMIPALAPAFNRNWIQIAFSIADVVNKVGVGVLVYLVGAHAMNQRVPEDAVEPAYNVS